jgi:hypothetical protein
VTDLAIDDLLDELGLSGDDAATARRILEQEGLTNPRKRRISLTKVGAAESLLDARLQRVCHSCRGRARADGRTVVEVPRAACPVCAGSSNRRAVDELVEACRRAHVGRLLAIGGSPNMRRSFAELVGGRLELRLVDGMRASDRRTAQGDIAWADLVVVLGATQLAHKVSTLYTRDPEARRKLVTTSRRGIEAIADAIARSDAVRPAE